VINRAGFRVDEDGETTTYLILTEVFRNEVCDGFDYRTVLKALDARGFLETQPPRLTKKCRLTLPAIAHYSMPTARSGASAHTDGATMRDNHPIPRR